MSHDAPWDALQREVLSELGLQPYVVAGAPEPATEAVPEPLLGALSRAARLPADRVPAQLASLGVRVDALRTGHAAKRALWLRLRALRRG